MLFHHQTMQLFAWVATLKPIKTIKTIKPFAIPSLNHATVCMGTLKPIKTIKP